jgi:hypothetical protein
MSPRSRAHTALLLLSLLWNERYASDSDDVFSHCVPMRKTSRIRHIYAMFLFYILAADHLFINRIITFLGFALHLPSPSRSTSVNNVLISDNRVHNRVEPSSFTDNPSRDPWDE